MKMPLLKNKIIQGVDAYLEKRKTRQFVGTLSFDKRSGYYLFVYDPEYLLSDNSIPLGPELPLTKKNFKSKKLFLTFIDRIPSKDNPAYQDYCNLMGISVDEEDILILLATIGKRGPSSFMFEPRYLRDFDHFTLKNYRTNLGMTTREFASCFEIKQSQLVNIEQGKVAGKELLKRMEIYYNFPQDALYQVLLNGGMLHTNTQKNVIKKLMQEGENYPININFK
jgi:HipA-like protein